MNHKTLELLNSINANFGLSLEPVIEEFNRSSISDMSEEQEFQLLTMSIRPLIEAEPDYTYLAAQVENAKLNLEVKRTVGVTENACEAETFIEAIHFGVDNKRLSPELRDLFDLNRLAEQIQPQRTELLTYLGLQTLYDRYVCHHKNKRIETIQGFFMRVAMGLSLREDNPTLRAIALYHLFSSLDYMPSTPTLFNSGTLHSQLSSCFLLKIEDDLYNIYGRMRDNAMLSKWAGGLGNDWTSVRALNSHIEGTNGKSQGVVPFLKVANDTAVAVNQGGKRKGAMCAFLETWHLDIEEFLELRKNTGDDRRRTHDMNTANWIPDLFMQRVFEEGNWTLFSPSETPDLHEIYGVEFAERYTHYEKLASQGKMQQHKVLKAKDLWRKMLAMLFETGHPWLTFKDVCNLRSPQQHVGVVHSSNLCTEITLNTSIDEVAVCNLGSINLPNHIVDGKLDVLKLRNTIRLATRALDNVIDINFYPIPEAKNSNMQHRPVGLGLMGFQDALYKLGHAYASDEAVEFADISMEYISYYAIEASSDLAVERGKYPSFEGSLWSKGILPIDSLDLVAKARPEGMFEVDRSASLAWDVLRKKVMRDGMRNSNVMAIAPTATISNIVGVSQSIEPTYQNLYVKSNLSGEFTVINKYLIEALKEIGFWNKDTLQLLKTQEGSVQALANLPEKIKAMFKTAFEVDAKWLIECASRRQKWVDQAQSLNLYIAGANGKKLDLTYRMAWLRGLKTTYYLRALGATSAEKSTAHTSALNAVSGTPDFIEAAPVPLACSIDNPECEACQ